MYAIIREGNGQYYMSMVFGYYDMGRNSNDYKHRYWVVLNKEKTALVNQATLFPDSKYLSPVVLIADSDESNWRNDRDKMQSVDFLPTETLFDLIENNTISVELLQRCISLDKEYVYNPYPEVSSEKDIKDLEEWVAGRFHDAYISEIEEYLVNPKGEYIIMFNTEGLESNEKGIEDLLRDFAGEENYNEYLSNLELVEDFFNYRYDHSL